MTTRTSPILPPPVPPIAKPISLNRGLPPETAITWLKAGWSDFVSKNMEASLLYGIVVFGLSAAIIGGIFFLGLDYILFPAMAAFMVIGPTLAVGLYEKSRRIEQDETVGILPMILVRAKTPGQIAFVGLLLTLWILLWLRSGVLLYALFFGMHPFPGIGGATALLFTTANGWGLLITGLLFGALFAAFAFAVSVMSIPMLLTEKTDAFTAMGSSIVLTWHNLPVMLSWGAVVFGLTFLCMITGLIGLIVVFPVLGHSTWHVYRAIRQTPDTPIFIPAIADDEPVNESRTG